MNAVFTFSSCNTTMHFDQIAQTVCGASMFHRYLLFCLINEHLNCLSFS